MKKSIWYPSIDIVRMNPEYKLLMDIQEILGVTIKLKLRNDTTNKQKKNKIAVLTLAIGTKYKYCVRKALQSKREYCEENGYDFIVGGMDVYDGERPIAWSKINMIKKYLPQYDYVFCSDADVVMMNNSVRLESFIDEHLNDEVKMILTRDWQNLNTGNVIMKNDPAIMALMDDIYANTKFMNHNWWEQAAFIDIYDKRADVKNMVHVITDSHLLNAYYYSVPGYPLPENNKYREGDLLVHLAGIDDMDELERCIEEILGLGKK